MKTNFQLTACAFLLGISGASQAALIQTATSSTFNFSHSQTDTNPGPNHTSSSNVALTGTSPILSKFHSATGVLTGAAISLNSTRTQTVDGSATKDGGPARTANFNGNSTGKFDGTGISPQTFASVEANTSCSLSGGPNGSGCTAPTGTSGAVSTDALPLAVNSANLNAYAGNGDVNGLTFKLPTISANISGTSNITGTSASTMLTWEGNVEATYTYLLHADASFRRGANRNSLTLDFGTVLQNSAAPGLAFSLFNLADDNRTGLDLDSIDGSGNTSAFNSGLSPFLNLAQDDSNLFSASMLTSNAGAFNAQYILNLSDADVGASNNWKDQQLTLTLTGNVTPVPLPGAVWLFGTAMAGLISMSRRKHLA